MKRSITKNVLEGQRKYYTNKRLAEKQFQCLNEAFCFVSSFVLHKEFRITNNGFMGTKGVTIIDKQKYLSNIKEGIFGGLPRIMTIERIDENGTIASVKLRLESAENHFVSFNSLVLDADDEWRIINNLAIVVSKK